MKKIIMHSLFALIAATSFSAHAEYIAEDQLSSVVGSNYTNTAIFFRGDSWFLPAKYFTICAAPAAALGWATGKYPQEKKDGALILGGLSGATGLFCFYVDRWVRVHQMNHFLKEYASVSRLKDLSNAEAALLCAAHYKDLGVMKVLLSYLPEFLHEMGTWEVLTELYYDEPDSTVTNSGTSVRPGYSHHGGWHIDATSHSSVSQVKHAYMRPEVMARRMKVLKKKLGYID